MFNVIPPTHPLRPVVEEVIRTAFFREYGARLTVLPWWLVAEVDAAGVACTASLRFANDGFFSERYLDEPVELLVARHAGTDADRATISEVGSLAALRPGSVTSLVRGVARLLQARGTHWAFFTATDRLRTLLRRAGIPLFELAPADPARIDGVSAWGGYYRHDPRVMLVGDHMLGPGFNSVEYQPRCRHA